MILGLDISTSITGYTIIHDGKLIKIGAWDTRNKNKFPTLFDKAEFIRKDLKKLQKIHKINEIFIEQPFAFFKSGGSTAKTMATLQKYNGVVSWICYDVFGIQPRYFTAQQARKMCGIKIPRGENAKKVVLQFVLDNEPTFKVEYTKFGNPKSECYDMADSIVIAKAGYTECQRLKN